MQLSFRHRQQTTWARAVKLKPSTSAHTDICLFDQRTSPPENSTHHVQKVRSGRIKPDKPQKRRAFVQSACSAVTRQPRSSCLITALAPFRPVAHPSFWEWCYWEGISLLPFSTPSYPFFVGGCTGWDPFLPIGDRGTIPLVCGKRRSEGRMYAEKDGTVGT